MQDNIAMIPATRTVINPFPWTGHPEDHVAPEQFISRFYHGLYQNLPRFAWAPSPAAMYTAINLLRNIQSGQRHKFIEGLVLASDVEGAAQRSVLDAIIDRTVTTTMGGLIREDMLQWRSYNRPQWLTDLRGFLFPHTFIPQTIGSRGLPGPNVNEVTLYPANYHHCIGAMQRNALSFVPYLHLCWFCLPPTEAQVYEDGHLAFMRFADGYVIKLPHPSTEKELPETPEVKGLSGEVKEM